MQRKSEISGSVIWLTGLSGAGKTTIAREFVALAKSHGILPVWLDGDLVRHVVGDVNCGHDPQSRLQNAYRICRLAKLVFDQGHVVIVSTMSLFHEVHDWNRQNFSRYFEVFIKADHKTLHERDPKGLYDKFRTGLEKNMPGMDLEPQFPRNADYILENHFHAWNIRPLAQQIWDAWREKADR